ncbi:hypothetical protein DPMN_172649 [Dreissena polymorpha]|uniref:Uncharacterized protein n=1 Tax=Dreissena polymorpha TaxID=45954 RepID=A0A9D4IFC3_DREPO|nr:hypothetical protein DPMN_172649 [Dreissena polymorpha]
MHRRGISISSFRNPYLSRAYCNLILDHFKVFSRVCTVKLTQNQQIPRSAEFDDINCSRSRLGIDHLVAESPCLFAETRRGTPRHDAEEILMEPHISQTREVSYANDADDGDENDDDDHDAAAAPPPPPMLLLLMMMLIMYRQGPRQLPWGTLHSSGRADDNAELTLTRQCRGCKYVSIQPSAVDDNPYCISTSVKMPWSTVSKAALRSMAINAVTSCLPIPSNISFTCLNNADSH